MIITTMIIKKWKNMTFASKNKKSGKEQQKGNAKDKVNKEEQKIDDKKVK